MSGPENNLLEQQKQSALAEVKRIERIEKYVEMLKQARRDLKLINDYVAKGSSWAVELELTPEDGSGYYRTRAHNYRMTVPPGVVQQHAINLIVAIEREIRANGGVVPAESAK